MGPALRALAVELHDGDELIVIDNASTDGTPEAVAEAAPDATLIEVGREPGVRRRLEPGRSARVG